MTKKDMAGFDIEETPVKQPVKEVVKKQPVFKNQDAVCLGVFKDKLTGLWSVVEVAYDSESGATQVKNTHVCSELKASAISKFQLLSIETRNILP